MASSVGDICHLDAQHVTPGLAMSLHKDVHAADDKPFDEFYIERTQRCIGPNLTLTAPGIVSTAFLAEYCQFTTRMPKVARMRIYSFIHPRYKNTPKWEFI